MTIGIPIRDIFLQGPLFVTHVEHNVAFPPPICQPSVVVIHLLSVSPGGYLKWLKYPQLVALFEPGFFFGGQIPRPSVCLVLKTSKYPEPVVL